MTSFLFFPIYILPIIIAVFYGYYKATDQKEEFLIPKLIGYFFLGTFIFWLDWFPLPVGIVIAYFLKPQKNAKTKKNVVYIGFAISIVSQLLIF